MVQPPPPPPPSPPITDPVLTRVTWRWMRFGVGTSTYLRQSESRAHPSALVIYFATEYFLLIVQFHEARVRSNLALRVARTAAAVATGALPTGPADDW